MAFNLCAQDTAVLVRTLTVKDGLPQSFISGLIQDETGFVWVATRDGLVRYDGNKFKVFNHKPGDSTSLSANIISNIYLDSGGRLWIMYESGETDLLNTATEQLLHLTQSPIFKPLQAALKSGVVSESSFAEDTDGNIWLPRKKDGVFIVDPNKHDIHFFTDSSLGLKGNPIVGLARQGSNVLLVTDTALVWMDAKRHIQKSISYGSNIKLYNPKRIWKDAYPVVRKNGEIVILDEQNLLVYFPKLQVFKKFPLPFRNHYHGPNIMQDEKGDVFFDFDGIIYRLSSQNDLAVWRSQKIGRSPESQCMLKDKSGMIWVGGNGSGIQLYDQRLPHLSGKIYTTDFTKDIFANYLNLKNELLENKWVNGINPYLLRWAKEKNGKLWIARSGYEDFDGAIGFIQNGHMYNKKWKFAGDEKANPPLTSINALAFSNSGKLWGLDFDFRPVYFDTLTNTATVYPSMAKATGANSMVMDGESIFWISSNFHGLYRCDLVAKSVRQYIPDTNGKGFPSAQTSIILQDLTDTGKLWIGTLGSGLIHFTKQTGACKLYTTNNGLPNNTVYAMLPDAKGRLWCSTNKGIFRLDPKTDKIYTITAKDGLPGDEFNRFHFLPLPNGQMAFGGVDGYIVFDPLTLSEDNFNPTIAITDIYINNEPADFGSPNSPLKQAINSLSNISLPHYSNFITFEFAALEYNSPEKLNYRYKLEGYDKDWVASGEKSIAVYTKLPPGNYTFMVEATNTAGKWGSKPKQLVVDIAAPFWQTWWFRLLCFLIVAGIVGFIIYFRLKTIRNKEKQQLQYERKAMELEAQALRAQMNPHFIFNCLNSIKSLIHEDKKQEAVVYLTTFSKLIRAQLANSQKEISLHDELETCKLYARLEGLRFGNKIAVHFSVAENVDTYSVLVPPLILQPFIENAIWHGILPLETGGMVNISILNEQNTIKCIVDDNGIGRQRSQLNKSKTNPTHQSKGMQLIQERLDLDSQIYNRGGWLQIEDKTDARGNATGTRVTIHLKTEK